MFRLRLQKLDPAVTPAPDVPGVTVTIPMDVNVPDPQGLAELLDWLRENPNFLAMLIAAFLALLGGLAPPRKAA